MGHAPRFLDRQLRMQQMRLLIALGKTCSLSKAARTLGLTQPALTKALRALEESVGEVLFERHAQGVTPTPEGELMIRFAHQMLADLSRLEDDLDRLANPGQGLVVLGAFPVAAAGLLPPLVKAVRARYPNLEVRLEEARAEVLLPKLAAGELDMVLGRLYEPELPDGLQREPLYCEPISLIARSDHPVFAQGEFEAAPSRWGVLLPTFSQRLGREIEHFIAQVGLSIPSNTIRSGSHLFIREMVHESDMIAVAPQLLMAGALRRSTLRTLPTRHSASPRPAGLILNPARPLHASAAMALVEIRAAIAELLLRTGSGILPIA